MKHLPQVKLAAYNRTYKSNNCSHYTNRPLPIFFRKFVIQYLFFNNKLLVY
jgi:hypothetical protein